MKDKGYWIIWPEYLDKNRTKGKGRKLPKQLCIENPTVEIIAKACKLLALEYVIEKDKKYPKSWFEAKGRVLIRRVPGKKKSEILKEIAKVILNKDLMMNANLSEAKAKDEKEVI